MSPTPATDAPNLSLEPSSIPDKSSPIDVSAFTDPSEFICTIRTCPKPPSAAGAPAAMSGTPSLSKSPMPATALPSLPSSCNGGVRIVAALRPACPSTPPSLFIKRT